MSSSPFARATSPRSAWVSRVAASERVEHALRAARTVEHREAAPQPTDPQVRDDHADKRDDGHPGGTQRDLVEQGTIEGQHDA